MQLSRSERIEPRWPVALAIIAVLVLLHAMPLFVLTLISGMALLRALILAMIYGSGISGLQLLTSSVAVWVVNILAFSLLYWQIDRGGPEARLHHTHSVPDFLFGQAGTSGDLTTQWRAVDQHAPRSGPAEQRSTWRPCAW